MLVVIGFKAIMEQVFAKPSVPYRWTYMYLGFSNMKQTEIFLLRYLDVMLVHCRVTPSTIYTPKWKDAL